MESVQKIDDVADLCKVVKFGKKFKRIIKSKRLTSNPVGMSATDLMKHEIEDSIPEPEYLLHEKEKA